VFPRRSTGRWEEGTSVPVLFAVELSPRPDMLRRFRISRQDIITVNMTVGLNERIISEAACKCRYDSLQVYGAQAPRYFSKDDHIREVHSIR
jgi:hypothetical protein